jgi:pimeloyl-ACP methyl ester carboxylesterase
MLQDGRVTTSADHLVPDWPGQLIDLPGGERVYVAATYDPEEGEGGEGGGGVRENAKELLLCVHGMAGAATNWTDFMAELAGEFDCAALDLPGSGWSPRPATMAGYRISAHVAVVIQLIERLGRGPVHLVGNSMGGLIAVKVAASRPDLIRTLTLLSPALPDPRISPTVARFPMIAAPRLGAWLLSRADAYPTEARVRAVMATVFHDPGSVHPERVRQAVAETERRDQLGYANECLIGAARAILAEYLRPGWAPGNGWRAAAGVQCPVLAIYGSHDQLVDPRMAVRAARAFQDSRVIVLPGTGHVAQMEHPARAAAEFRQLAAAHGGSRAGQGTDGDSGPGMPAELGGLDPVTETLK